jgi:hypothetical protein
MQRHVDERPAPSSIVFKVRIVALGLFVSLVAACRPDQKVGQVVIKGGGEMRPAAVVPGSQCPDTPSQILLPLRPRDPGYTGRSAAPPPDTVVSTDVLNIKVPYDTALRHVFDIPEYHDCQRLYRPDATYGPLAGIFSLDATHAPYTDSDFGQPGGVAVALIFNYSNNDPLYPGMINTTVPTTPSTGVDPKSLGKRSCLYLHYGSGGWQARLWQVPTSLPTCPRTLPSAITTLAMTVVRTTPMPDTADYPPAARWDLTDNGSLQYMGVRCLAGWCEIAPKNFTPSHVVTMTPDRYHTVKGWYDQQYLAVNPGGGAAVPSKMLGRLYPENDLNALTISDYSCEPALLPAGEPFASLIDPHRVDAIHAAQQHPRKCDQKVTTAAGIADDPNGYWTKVASIHISDADTTYRRKFKLDEKGEAFVYLRYNPHIAEPKLRWQVRYAPMSGGPGKVVTAKRVDHSMSTFGGSKLVVPATVRWKWVLNDEYAWSRCSYGCCDGFDY